MVLYLGAVPWSKDDLEEKCEEHRATASSPNCPTIAIRLLSQPGGTWTGFPLALGPTEESGDRVGLGHLGLVEGIGPGEITFPDTDEYERELVELLRSCAPRRNVSLSRLADLYSRPDTFNTVLRDNASFEWPKYRGLVQLLEDGDQQANGVASGQSI